MSDTEAKRRNLVILSDGTGNRAGKGRGTNVWLLYEALDRHHTEELAQLAIHDDGVGTSNNTLLAALGGAVGLGLARNVRELYAWLCTQYNPDTDHIYLFGFSRGAFTVRCLAGIITKFGIIKGADMPRSELRRWVNQVWFAFKQTQSQPEGDFDFQRRRPWINGLLDRIRGKELPQFFQDITIDFMGVWDTVDAYGLPVDELKEAFAWASMKLFRFWPLRYLAMTRFSDRKLSKQVLHAYHALAIDDERLTFHPVLWDEESRPEDQTIEQVWFCGMHSDVGGGYVRRSLSLVTLNWMMLKARDRELRFNEEKWNTIKSEANPLGPLHDSRSGLSAFYRYWPRDLRRLCEEHNIPKPIVHASVLERVRGLHAEDAPGGVPEDFDVETNSGAVTSLHRLRPDPECLARLRTYHKRRYRLYLASVAWAAGLVVVLVAFRDQAAFAPAPAWSFLGIGSLLSMVEKFVPEMVGGFVRTLRGAPFYTILLLVSLVLLRMTGTGLVGRIRELRRAAWDGGFRRKLFQRRGWRSTTPSPSPAPMAAGRATGKTYRKTVVARLIVFAIAALLVLWAISWYRTGKLFPANAVVDPARVEYGPIRDAYRFDFQTNNPGYRVGPVLQRGERYKISVDVVEPWSDDGLASTPEGLQVEPTRAMRLFPWIRRDWRYPWFALLGTLGSENGDKFVIGSEYVIDKLSEDTRLYLFVNDATCYLCPGGPWKFYENNEGAARVTIRRLSN